MAFSAADIPNRVDVLINGDGYMLAETEDTKAVYGLTPTFIPRQNVQGEYGDNQQDFWLSFSQNDWSLGLGQKYFRLDEERRRRFWDSTGIDVTTQEGEFRLYQQKEGLGTSALAVLPIEEDTAYVWNSTNLFEETASSTIDRGAHGLGAGPYIYGVAHDGYNVYFTTTGSGTVGVRKWDQASFSTFSSVPSDAICYVNNTLFGFRNDTSRLQSYDTAGTATTIHTFQEADGTALTQNLSRLVPFGGKVILMRAEGERMRSPAGSVTGAGGDLHIYDGVGLSKIMEFPPDFFAGNICVAFGVVYIGGAFVRRASTVFHQPAVLYWANGSSGILWRHQEWTSATDYAPYQCAVTPFREGIAFTNEKDAKIMYYDAARGGVTSLTSYNSASTGRRLIEGGFSYFLLARTNDGTKFWPSGNLNTTGTLTTSLIDFDSSLDKIFRGIKVEFESGTSSTVDIAYRVNDLDGSYTSLQTNATSGTEYLLSGVTGRSISIRVTINYSGANPTTNEGCKVKRISLRASPKQVNYRKDTFVLVLGGRDGEQHVQLRDGTLHPKDGKEQAEALRTVATNATPVTIVDEFGSFTGIIENEGLQIRRYRTHEYLAIVPVREV